jgi:molybdenum cofactor cytidylyltransferase
MDNRIFAILLASGFSKRYGTENKLLVPFQGKPLAHHTLDLVCSTHFFCKIFFIYADEQVAALAAGLPVTAIHNTAPEKGQRESVRLGVHAASQNGTVSDYYMFFPCDQPLLDIETIGLIIKNKKPGCIVEPCFQGKPGSPCLFSAVFKDELLNLNEGEYPRIIKARHPESLVRVTVENPQALVDIDEKGDADLC